jgi:hypothetical protein
MPDEPSRPSGPPGQPDRRRPAPTIELKATEIARDPPAAAAGEPEQPPVSEHQEAQSQESASASDRQAKSDGRGTPLWLSLGAGIAGAVLTLAVAWLVMFATRDNDPRAMQTRIATLERQIADLSRRQASPNTDLAARLQKLEGEVGALSTAGASAGDPALASRLAAIETEMHSLHDMAEALSGRTEDIAAGLAAARKRADTDAAALAELAKRPAPAGESPDQMAAMLAQLADRVGALEARPSAASDRVARAAAVAGALSAAVERGAPFAAELKAAQSQAPDPKVLAPLEPFAAAGLPSASALARDLAALEPHLVATAEPAPGQGGYLDKLAAHAKTLFRFQSIDQAPSGGDEPLAIMQRAEFKASHADLAGALAELAKLPTSAQTSVEPWIEKAQARMAALAASRKFAADALAALGKP